MPKSDGEGSFGKMRRHPLLEAVDSPQQLKRLPTDELLAWRTNSGII